MQLPTDPYILLFQLWDQFGNSPYVVPAIIGITVFVFLILLALVKKHIFELSMKGATFGFVCGVLVMLVLNLIIIMGLSDKEKMKKLVSGENQQEAIQGIFISGVSNIGNVLGVSTTVTATKTHKPKTAEEMVNDFLTLPDEDADKLKKLLCPR